MAGLPDYAGMVGGDRAVLKQRASTFEVLVQLAHAGVEIDPRSIRALAQATDAVTAHQGGVWSVSVPGAVDVSDRDARLLGRAKVLDVAGVVIDPRDVTDRAAREVGKVYVQGTVPTDPVDRAARLAGIVYGSLDKVQQRAVTLELLTQLRHAGIDIDPRAIRALTVADVVSAVQSGAWSVSVPGVATEAKQDTSILRLEAIRDRLPAALTGAGNLKVSLQESITPDVNVTDRAARLLGILYGDQGQFAQRAVTRDALVQVRHAGVEVDPRSIRALTASDVVTVQGALTDAELRASAVPVSFSGVVDTELPAAVALSDALANPTSPLVGACLLYRDQVTGNFRRWNGGANGANVFLNNGENSSGNSVAHHFATSRIGANRKEAALQGVTADTLLYTVNGGTTLKFRLIITVRNTDTLNDGILHIRDGTTVAGAIKFSITVPIAVAGTAVHPITIPFGSDAFPEQFTTGIFLDEAQGTLTVDARMVGIEE